MNYNVELGERVIAAMFQENTGPSYNRIAHIKDRAIDAQISAALVEVPVCDFRNKYGWCIKDKGHSGTHTVINLGNDEE